MKSLLLIFLCALSFCSCKLLPGSDKRISDPEHTSYKLKLAPAAGSRYTYTIKNTTAYVMESDEKKIENTNESNVTVDYAIDKDTGNNYIMNMRYTDIKMHVKNGDAVTDADASQVSYASSPLEKMLGNVTDAHIQATVTQQGDVLSITGLAELKAALLARLDTNDRYARQVASTQLDKMIGEGLVRRNLDQLFRIFPDSVVRIGDKWKLDTKQAGDFGLAIKSFYVLKAINDDIALIEAQSEVQSDPTQKTVYGGSAAVNLKGSQKATYTIQTKTGMLMNCRQSAVITGTIQAVGRELPISIHYDITIEGKAN